MPPLTLSVPVRQVSVSRFGGLYTEADQRDLPIGSSPLNSDCDFRIGSTTIRPGLVSIQQFTLGGIIAPTATLDYIRGALFNWFNSVGPVNIFQADDGTFWVAYETAPNATQIYNGILNNARMLSETFGPFEYCALGAWGSIQNRIPLQGVDQPRTLTLNGVATNQVQFDRISQAPPAWTPSSSNNLLPSASSWAANGTGTTGPGIYGPLAAGTRYAVLMFQMRNGYITPASMPQQFTTAANNSAISFTNLPSGPPETQYLIAAVTIPVPTPTGVTNPPNAGIGGPYFYVPLSSPYPTVVPNGTASFVGAASDVLITSGINITVPGNNLLTGNQRELGECVKCINYGGRAFYLGERTKTDNLVNLTFDGGTNNSGPTGVPPGWTQTGTNLAFTLQPSPIYGLSLQITNVGSGTVNGGFPIPPGTATVMTATAGTPQSAIVLMGFATNLQVKVTDSRNAPIAQVPVTFTAPTFGPSGTWGGFTSVVTVNTNTSGLATAPAFTANSAPGSYTVTATASGIPTVNFALTNAPSSGTTPPAPPAPATVVLLSSFGTVGTGGNDTTVWQNALNSTASAGQALRVSAATYNVSPLTFPANAYVIVDSGVTVNANTGYGSNACMLNLGAANITIVGAGATSCIFQMPNARSASIADGSQYRHCLNIQGATNVYVSGISCNQSGGDGCYLRQSTNVTVTNCIFDNNYRQGSSITGQVNHVFYVNDNFTNTNGTAPQAGIDIEPNSPTDFLLDVNITGCNTNNNAGDGILFSLWKLTSASQAIGITVSNHTSTGNHFGYHALNADPTNAPGSILVQNSSSTNSVSYGATARFWASNGASLVFQNLTVTNPNTGGPDSSYGDKSAVTIIRGGGATVPEGNVQFNNTSISATTANTDYYFNFQDGSNKGIQNATFTPGTLTGAAMPNGYYGLVNGVGTKNNHVP